MKTKLTADEAKNFIRSSIMVGLRKGVDSRAAGRLYGAVNPLFFYEDKAIQDIGNEFVNALTDNAYQTLLDGGDEKAIGAKFAEAAKVDRTACTGVEFAITPENQGFSCLQMILPIEHQSYGDTFRYEVPSEGRRGEIQITRRRKDSIEWEFFRWERVDGDLLGLILLKLVDEHPELKARFADAFVSREGELRKEIFESATAMEDDDWEALASWILYNLGD